MTPVAGNPVVVPDRELEEEKNLDTSEPPRIRCPLCGWSLRKEDKPVLHAGMSGTRSTREECAQLASTSGLKR